MLGETELRNRFTYHPPEPSQIAVYQSVRNAGLELARHIDESAPDSREKSLAITKIEEAVMWANAAIARIDYVTGLRKIPAD